MSEINSRNLVEHCLKTQEELKQWQNWLVDQKIYNGAPVFRVSRRSNKDIVIAVLPRALGISNQEFIVDVKSLKSMGVALPPKTQAPNSSALEKTLKD